MWVGEGVTAWAERQRIDWWVKWVGEVGETEVEWAMTGTERWIMGV